METQLKQWPKKKITLQEVGALSDQRVSGIGSACADTFRGNMATTGKE